MLLFSGGKDSVVLLRLAEKAFWPARVPFPVMHVDTGHNFPEVLEFRDRRVAELGVRARRRVGAGGDRRRAAWSRSRAAARRATGCRPSTLLDAIEEHRFDAVFGGGRRDEEKARAKERVFSLPRRVRAVGPEEPAARAVEPLQRPPPHGRAHPRLPALELDRARRLAVHRRRRRSSSPPSTSPTGATVVPPRRHAAGGRPVPRAAATTRRSSRRSCATAPSAT